MKSQNKIAVLILLLTTSVLMWIIPEIVKIATISPTNYPFVYFSSKLKGLCLIDFSNKEYPMQDLKGNKYTTAQMDSLVPLFNFRQLMSEGLLPDSIDGVEITPRLLMSKTVVSHFSPSDFSVPKPALQGMLETMPLRGGLKTPNDLFRIDNEIVFINAESNQVDEEKSQRFAQLLKKRGYQFPTQWAEGNASTRKAYDEGYFCLDNANRLFHIKLVNGKPYIRDTKVSESINIDRFVSYNPSDKRFYGYIFSKEGDLFILEPDSGAYVPHKLDMPRINFREGQIMVMGNLLYWVVSVSDIHGKSYYAMHTESLKLVEQHFIPREPHLWDKTKQFLMPFYISMESYKTAYIYPMFHFSSMGAFILSGLLAIIAFFGCTRGCRTDERLFKVALVALTGIAGMIAVLILPKFSKP